jgi:competence protein ComEA
MKQVLRNYFSFSRRERNGIIILLLLIGIVIVAHFFVHLLVPHREPPDLKEFQKEIALFKSNQLTKQSQANDLSTLSSNTRSAKKLNLFEFDPNGLPVEQWMELGFSEKQSHVIKNYELRSGGFHAKEDLKKLYVISDAHYEKLEPYIKIEKKKVTIPKILNSQSLPEFSALIDLNTADTNELKKIVGIGSFYASQITQLRKKLGGFVQIDQLWEVYRMDSITFNSITPYVYVQTNNVKRISINTASQYELLAHPYIDFNTARLIVHYRNQHGQYKSVSGLKQLVLVNDEIYTKIAPYLTVD